MKTIEKIFQMFFCTESVDSVYVYAVKNKNISFLGEIQQQKITLRDKKERKKNLIMGTEKKDPKGVSIYRSLFSLKMSCSR